MKCIPASLRITTLVLPEVCSGWPAKEQKGADRRGDGDAWATDALVSAGKEYIDLLRQHIDKENNVLLMMADCVVDESLRARLGGEGAHVCSGRVDDRTKEQPRELAAELTRDFA